MDGRKPNPGTVPAPPVSLGARFSLRFLEGRALLGARGLPGRGVTVEDLSLEVPHVRYPMDITGGADRFQHQRLRVRDVGLAIPIDGLASWMERALPGRKLDVLEWQGVLDLGVHGPQGQELLLRVGLVPAPPDGVDAVVLRAVASGPSRLAPLPSLVALAGALQAQDPKLGPLVWRLPALQWALGGFLLSHGWKLPDVGALRDVAVEVAGGSVRIHAGDGPVDPLLLARAQQEQVARAMAASLALGALAGVEDARMLDRVEHHPLALALVAPALAHGALKEEALAAVDAALARNGKNLDLAWARAVLLGDAPVVWRDLAHAAERAGEFLMAHAAAMEASRLAPDGDPQALAVAVRVRPDTPGAALALAVHYSKGGQWADVMSTANEALERGLAGEDEALAARLLGEARLELGDAPGARRALLRALRHAETPETLKAVARVHEHEGRLSEAVRDFLRAGQAFVDGAQRFACLAAAARITAGPLGDARGSLPLWQQALESRVDAASLGDAAQAAWEAGEKELAARWALYPGFRAQSPKAAQVAAQLAGQAPATREPVAAPSPPLATPPVVSDVDVPEPKTSPAVAPVAAEPVVPVEALEEEPEDEDRQATAVLQIPDEPDAEGSPQDLLATAITSGGVNQAELQRLFLASWDAAPEATQGHSSRLKAPDALDAGTLLEAAARARKKGLAKAEHWAVERLLGRNALPMEDALAAVEQQVADGNVDRALEWLEPLALRHGGAVAERAAALAEESGNVDASLRFMAAAEKLSTDPADALQWARRARSAAALAERPEDCLAAARRAAAIGTGDDLDALEDALAGARRFEELADTLWTRASDELDADRAVRAARVEMAATGRGPKHALQGLTRVVDAGVRGNQALWGVLLDAARASDDAHARADALVIMIRADLPEKLLLPVVAALDEAQLDPAQRERADAAILLRWPGHEPALTRSIKAHQDKDPAAASLEAMALAASLVSRGAPAAERLSWLILALEQGRKAGQDAELAATERLLEAARRDVEAARAAGVDRRALLQRLSLIYLSKDQAQDAVRVLGQAEMLEGTPLERAAVFRAIANIEEHQLGNLERAGAALEHALRANPDDAEATKALVRLWDFLAHDGPLADLHASLAARTTGPVRTAHLLAEGDVRVSRLGQRARAMECFRAALKESPASDAPLKRLVDVVRGNSNAGLVRAYLMAARLRGGAASAVLLEDAGALLGGLMGRPRHAAAVFLRASQLAPARESALRALAEFQTLGGQFDAANATWGRLVAAAPDARARAMAHASRGELLLRVGRAEDALRESVKAAKESAGTDWSLTLLRESAQRTPGETPLVEAAAGLAAEGPQATALLELARLLLERGHHASAAQVASRAAAGLPRLPDAWMILGHAAEHEQDVEGQARAARALMDIQVDGQPHAAAAQAFKLGGLLRTLGRHAEAADIFNQAAQLNPSLRAAPVEQARSLLDAEDASGAWEILGLLEQPEDAADRAEVARLQAKAALEAGAWSEVRACQWVVTALPADAQARQALALALEKEGRFRAAAPEWNCAASLETDPAIRGDWLRQAARAYAESSQHAAAVQSLLDARQARMGPASELTQLARWLLVSAQPERALTSAIAALDAGERLPESLVRGLLDEAPALQSQEAWVELVAAAQASPAPSTSLRLLELGLAGDAAGDLAVRALGAPDPNPRVALAVRLVLPSLDSTARLNVLVGLAGRLDEPQAVHDALVAGMEAGAWEAVASLWDLASDASLRELGGSVRALGDAQRLPPHVLERLRKVDPEDVDLIGAASQALDAANYEEALELISRMRQIDRAALLLRYQCQAELERWQDALATVEALASSSSISDETAWRSTAVELCRDRLEDPVKALVHARRWVALRPDHRAARAALVELLEEVGAYSQAAEEVAAWAKARSGVEGASLWRKALELARAGEDVQARIRVARAAFPALQDELTHDVLMESLEAAGRLAEAAQHAWRWAERAQTKESWEEAARRLSETGDNVRAAQALMLAFPDPTDAATEAALVQTLLTAGHTGAALDRLRRLMAQDQDNVAARSMFLTHARAGGAYAAEVAAVASGLANASGVAQDLGWAAILASQFVDQSRAESMLAQARGAGWFTQESDQLAGALDPMRLHPPVQERGDAAPGWRDAAWLRREVPPSEGPRPDQPRWLLRRLEEEALHAGVVDVAAKAYRALLEERPAASSPPAWTRLAGAPAVMARWAAEEPALGAVLTAWAQGLGSQAVLDVARAWAQAAESKSDGAQAWDAVALAAGDSLDSAGEQDAWERAQRLAPTAARATRLLEAARVLGDVNLQLEWMDRLAQLQPDRAAAWHVERAQLQVEWRLLDDAALSLDQAGRDAPGALRLWETLHAFAVNLGQTGLECRALAAMDRDALDHLALAGLHARDGQWPDALLWLDRAEKSGAPAAAIWWMRWEESVAASDESGKRAALVELVKDGSHLAAERLVASFASVPDARAVLAVLRPVAAQHGWDTLLRQAAVKADDAALLLELATSAPASGAWQQTLAVAAKSGDARRFLDALRAAERAGCERSVVAEAMLTADSAMLAALVVLLDTRQAGDLELARILAQPADGAWRSAALEVLAQHGGPEGAAAAVELAGNAHGEAGQETRWWRRVAELEPSNLQAHQQLAQLAKDEDAIHHVLASMALVPAEQRVALLGAAVQRALVLQQAGLASQLETAQLGAGSVWVASSSHPDARAYASAAQAGFPHEALKKLLDTARRQGDTRLAVTLLGHAVLHGLVDAGTGHLERATLLLRQGDSVGYLDALHEAAKADSHHVKTWVDAVREQEDASLMPAVLEEAVQLAKGPAKARLQLEWATLLMGSLKRPADALAVLRTVDVESAEAWRLRGLAAGRTGDTQLEALEAFERIKASQDADPIASIARVSEVFAFQLDDQEHARALLEMAAPLGPGAVDALSQKLLAAGRLEALLTLLHARWRVAPQEERSTRTRAWVEALDAAPVAVRSPLRARTLEFARAQLDVDAADYPVRLWLARDAQRDHRWNEAVEHWRLLARAAAHGDLPPAILAVVEAEGVSALAGSGAFEDVEWLARARLKNHPEDRGAQEVVLAAAKGKGDAAEVVKQLSAMAKQSASQQEKAFIWREAADWLAGALMDPAGAVTALRAAAAIIPLDAKEIVRLVELAKEAQDSGAELEALRLLVDAQPAKRPLVALRRAELMGRLNATPTEIALVLRDALAHADTMAQGAQALVDVQLDDGMGATALSWLEDAGEPPAEHAVEYWSAVAALARARDAQGTLARASEHLAMAGETGAWAHTADAYARLGQHEDAARAYQQAANALPEKDVAGRVALLRRAEACWEATDDTPSADAVRLDLLETDPSDAALFDTVEFRLKRTGKTARLPQLALKVADAQTDPARKAAMLERAALALRDIAGDETGAVNAFKRALEVEAGRPRSALGLADMAFRRDNLEDAARWFALVDPVLDGAVDDLPEAEWAFRRGLCLEATDHDGRDMFQRALELAPGHSAARRALADALVRHGEALAAARVLMASVDAPSASVDPAAYTAFIIRQAAFLEEAGFPTSATAILEDAFQQVPGSMELGRALVAAVKRDDPAQAAAVLHHLAQLVDPGMERGRLLQEEAECWEDAGRLQERAEALTEAALEMRADTDTLVLALNAAASTEQDALLLRLAPALHALETEPSLSPSVHLALAKALKQDRKADAARLLVHAKAGLGQEDSWHTRLVVVDASRRAQDWASLVEQIEAAVGLAQDNKMAAALALEGAKVAASQLGDASRCAALAQRAHNLMPNDAGVHVKLGDIFPAAGLDPVMATRVARLVMDAASPAPQAFLWMQRAAAAAGDAHRANAAAQAWLAAGGDAALVPEPRPAAPLRNEAKRALVLSRDASLLAAPEFPVRVARVCATLFKEIHSVLPINAVETRPLTGDEARRLAGDLRFARSLVDATLPVVVAEVPGAHLGGSNAPHVALGPDVMRAPEPIRRAVLAVAFSLVRWGLEPAVVGAPSVQQDVLAALRLHHGMTVADASTAASTMAASITRAVRARTVEPSDDEVAMGREALQDVLFPEQLEVRALLARIAFLAAGSLADAQDALERISWMVPPPAAGTRWWKDVTLWVCAGEGLQVRRELGLEED